MGSPFSGPRHQSWASNTIISLIAFVFTVGLTAAADYLNGPADPPAYLVGLCGMAGSALFGAVSSDKSKRDREIVADVETARKRSATTERRVGALEDFATSEHPEHADKIPSASEPPNDPPPETVGGQ